MDFMQWDAEIESEPAEDNLTLRHASAEAQQLLSRYRPIDNAAEWIDIELFLPDPPTPVSHSPQNYPHFSTLLTSALMSVVSLCVTSGLPGKMISACRGLNSGSA
jgi:RNA polymerase primary sigma factor